MKAILSALLALALAGCSPTPPPTPPAPKPDPVYLQPGRSLQVDMFLRAIEGLPNRALIVDRYQAAFETNTIEQLSQESESSLRSKLATLARGTSRHGYTAEQLNAALAVRAYRKAARDAKRVVHTDPALLTTNADGW